MTLHSPLTPPPYLADIDARVRDAVTRLGFHVAFVPAGHSATGEAYAYTTGLARVGAPELLLQCVDDPAVAHAVLFGVATRVLAGARFADGTRDPYTFSGGYLACIRDLTPERLPLLAASGRYAAREGLPLRAQVIACPDTHGAFPWEAAYDGAAHQPDLWTPPARSFTA